MEINDLQKMFLSICRKKSMSRGNLRLKVLLKSTYMHLKRNLMAEQLENCQKLQAALENRHAESHLTVVSNDVEYCQTMTQQSPMEISSDIKEPLMSIATGSVNVNTECVITDNNALQSSSKICGIKRNDCDNEITHSKQLKVLRTCSKENSPKIRSNCKVSSKMKTKRKLRITFSEWYKECGIDLAVKGEHCSPINCFQLKGIKKLMSLWENYMAVDSGNQPVLEWQDKILTLIRNLVRQYELHGTTNGDNEHVNEKLRRYRNKLKKVARSLLKIYI